MEVSVRFELTNTKVAASDLTTWLRHHKIYKKLRIKKMQQTMPTEIPIAIDKITNKKL